MSEAYVGEIRMFGFPRVPTDWLACNGALLSISQYEVLYALIGTTYGGNGQTNFQIPDLRGRVPVHEGQGLGLSPYVIGEMTGTETVALLSMNLPQHNHVFVASNADATTPNPQGGSLASVANNTPADVWYYPPTASPLPTAVQMAPNSVQMQGGTQPHDNMMPTLTVQFCICYAGIFPQHP